MALFGLRHIPTAETVVVKTKAEIDTFFDIFNIHLYKDEGIYYIECNDVNCRFDEDYYIKLIPEEFDIYQLTEEQENALDKEFRAKMDKI